MAQSGRVSHGQRNSQGQRDYLKLEEVGAGTYGKVWKVKEKHTGNIFAMKVMSTRCQEDGVSSTTIREVSLLKQLAHANVVLLRDIVFESNYRLSLVFEYLDYDLRKYMDRECPTGMDEREVISFLYQILRGLAFCHANRVFHRDLKPQNLLIDTDGNLKIADFGLARTFGTSLRRYTAEVVTLWYRAPELLLGKQNYFTAIDVWSVACIYYEMMNTKRIRESGVLFQGDCEFGQIMKVFQKLGTPNDNTWKGVSVLPHFQPSFPLFNRLPNEEIGQNVTGPGLDLLLRMLDYDPMTRISARAALDHELFGVRS